MFFCPEDHYQNPCSQATAFSNQYAFVQRRRIVDNIILAREAIHTTRSMKGKGYADGEDWSVKGLWQTKIGLYC